MKGTFEEIKTTREMIKVKVHEIYVCARYGHSNHYSFNIPREKLPFKVHGEKKINVLDERFCRICTDRVNRRIIVSYPLNSFEIGKDTWYKILKEAKAVW